MCGTYYRPQVPVLVMSNARRCLSRIIDECRSCNQNIVTDHHFARHKWGESNVGIKEHVITTLLSIAA